jgi:hypothetical protein
MRDHRTERRAAHVADPGTPEHLHQRRLLLELAVAPPAEGDDPRDLARALGVPRAAVEAAGDALVAAGLAERRAGRLFASPATIALDALWPIAL